MQFGPPAPNSLLLLFRCEKASELRLAAKRTTVTRSDLVEAIIAAQAGATALRIKSVYRDLTPRDLGLKPKDLDALHDIKPGPHSPASFKAFTKIARLVRGKVMRVCHLFYHLDGPWWWIVFYDVRDLHEPHGWVEGTHIHVLSWVTKRTMDPVTEIEKFRHEVKPRLPSGLHVRFDNEPDAEEARPPKRASLDSGA
ncbi:Uncharacterised protein [Brevundimonas vesicularis]|uniref:Uncharacterized protein n=1 Tax=Brevundimonas vesicularis TaxID=41276 RepID=A0A2X1BGI9_BREVE|nr:hypothetical protein [Brevundimonas vesicularis]SPU55857.1 Uncharacterised protein [Brevundimonas vesicularis]